MSVEKLDSEVEQLVSKDGSAMVGKADTSSGSPESARYHYRPDIDGLRGFGALLVLWFHFRETWSNSPYKGADLTNSTFFAVSGFVITLSVLRAREKNPAPFTFQRTGGFALIFLCRRLQRLILTQLVMTLVTIAVFCAVLTPGARLMSLITTARYSVIGGTNIYFGTRKVSAVYIDNENTETSLSKNPLMHTWYLGVEEQVYLIYPWLFAAAHLFVQKMRLSPYFVFGTVFIASLVCSLRVDRQSAKGFFMLQYRFWEVLVGVLTCHALIYSGLLDCRTHRKKDEEQGTTIRTRALIWPQVSFVLLETVAGFLFQFPEYSLTATIFGLGGTVVFFIAGHGYEWRAIYPTSTTEINFREVPFLNYIYGMSAPAYFGRISYSLYLWHFPVAVLCADYKTDIQQIIGQSDTAAFSLQFVVLVMISALTYHFVEDPFRWWRPKMLTRFLPAICVLLLVAAMEIWLSSLSYRAYEAAISEIMHTNHIDISPIVGKAELVTCLAIILLPALAIAWRMFFAQGIGGMQFLSKGKGFSSVWHRKYSVGLFLAMLALGSLFLEGGILTVRIEVNKPATREKQLKKSAAVSDSKDLVDLVSGDEVHGKQLQKLAAGSDTPALMTPGDDRHMHGNETAFSTFWNWRDGTHSFASYGCSCQDENHNINTPPGVSNNKDLPLCFDQDYWSSFPQAYESFRGSTQIDCTFESVRSRKIEMSTDSLWDRCMIPGRPSTGKRKTAFVVGNSASHQLRWAVANAIGGDFAIFGFSKNSFRTRILKPARISDLNTSDLGPRIDFDLEEANQVLQETRKPSVEKLQYAKLLVDVFDRHLSNGDLIFLTEHIVDSRELKSHLDGIKKLGDIARSRGATLVITIGQYLYQHFSSPEYTEPLVDYQERLHRHDHWMRELAAEAGESVIYWPFGEQLCGDRCSARIHGTELQIGGFYNGSEDIAVIGGHYAVGDETVDFVHPSYRTEAFMAPFLCSFLKEHSLIRPQSHKLEFRHDKTKLNMNQLWDGKDAYHKAVFRLPEGLAGGAALTHIQYDFPNAHHRDIVHHAGLYACDRFPKEALEVGKSFETPGVGLADCRKMIFIMGMESLPVALPVANGEQLAVPVEAEFILLEVHYKAPAGLVGNALSESKVLFKQVGDTLEDSSGLSATFVSQKEAASLGMALKFVQILELGPRDGLMLNLPPGRPNEKVSSICPRECFANALESANVPHISIMAAMLHAHLAATAMYMELIDYRTNASTIISDIPDYAEHRKHPERLELLPEAVSVTSDMAVKLTCTYNTMDRDKNTFLGGSLMDEMCYAFVMVSPPSDDLTVCWHMDASVYAQGGMHLGSGNNHFCRAQCGVMSSPKFKLPLGSSGWAANSDDEEQKEKLVALDERWPSLSTCEL